MSLIKRLFARPRTPKVGIAAIVKNEAPYLVEWIAFHQLVGITEFFIADNDSTDGTTALLNALGSAGIVTRLAYPTTDRGPQMPAYDAILARYGDRCDWLAFIDADEFIVPVGRIRSLPAHLAAIAGAQTGCVALNWAVYGSSGLKTRDERPVIERFTWRAARDQRINHTFKSIVRPAAAERFKDPHQAVLREGFAAVRADGGPLQLGRRAGHSESVCWSGFRINHYVIKSFAEWQLKRDRGRADHLTARRPETFFADKDYADERESPDPTLLAETKRRMESLAAVAGVLAP